MQCYTELLPPIGVTHALAVPFISATAKNLVVARTSLLQIFSLRITASKSTDLDDRLLQSGQDTTKLVLEREYSLPGIISDLCRVKTLNTKSGGESILLSFRDAKLSLIEWDPERYGISTVSIHYYERDDLARSPWISDLSSCGSILSADPSSRCAIFHFGSRNLAIIPFHQPGDDLVMDDYGADLGGETDARDSLKERSSTERSKDGVAHETPYAPSFVLPLTALDPSILHPISLTFLYEYREPTFGILYSQVATSNSLLHERKDVVFYTVFTLDLEQRASTTLLSVARLPSDLFKVVALPPPVGGSLLIGSNELVHVDQAGKTNAVGVNEFSRQVSSFSMTDQSDLALRLENCVVERISDSNGDLLLVLSTGEMVVLSFKLDGRSVSGVSVHPLPSHSGGSFMTSAASSSAFLDNGKVFFGSEDADSVLLGWSCSSSSTKKPRTQIKHTTGDTGDFSGDEQSEDDAYEDDLYSTAPETTTNGRHSSLNSSVLALGSLRVHDKLFSSGPLMDIAFGKKFAHLSKIDRDVEKTSSDLELVASQGSGRNGRLVVMNREIDPYVVTSTRIDSANNLWTASLAQPNSDENLPLHNYVIISKQKSFDKEESKIFIFDGQLKPFKAPEFNPNEDVTIEIGTLPIRNRVIQILRNEVRSYDIDLGLIQIYPVWDEDTSDERIAVSASLLDPYIAIIRDDSTLLLLQADDSGDLDELRMPEEIAANKWLSSCLYNDNMGVFSSLDPTTSKSPRQDILLFLLGQSGKLYVYRLSDHKLLSIIEGVDCVPPILSAELPKRSAVREGLLEAVVADLGDASSTLPYLILRTENDDLVVYRPFINMGPKKDLPKLKFFKETNHVLPRIPSSGTKKNEQSSFKPLRFLPNISGLSSIFMPGPSAGFIFKTSTNSPHFARLRGDYTSGLGYLHGTECEKGFISLDQKGIVRVSQLPHGIEFGYPWVFHQVPIGEQIDHLVYSSASESYILGTCHRSEFKLPEDDELHPEWRNEVISFLPEVDQSSIRVVSPKTWSVIDSYSLGPAEHVMAIKNMSLEVSENTHERRDMIVVGTALVRGEDIPARGCVYVFEVIRVVSDPDHPEIDRKLKLIGKEPVKGPVTALSEVGAQGFLIVVQGQKCMVRGLKEDGSLLPVAFMDMQCYISVVKELKGTGMCILGDAVKGLWFAGYSEEPYKMSLFAKDLDYLEVLAADFLPDGNKMFVLVADSDCNLHILQYDPEDPKSSNGDRLISRSKFHTGNYPSTLTLIPRTMVSSERLLFNNTNTSLDEMDLDPAGHPPQHQVLITSQNGAIGLVTCVPEESYRRLSALQSQLTNTLEHPCGLNPRAFRAVESDGSAGRGMLDGNLLFQWLDMSKQRKVDIANRVGAKEWEIRADLEVIGGDGLGYL